MVSFIARRCPISVFVLGLMSCNQKDVKTLNVPQPTWENEQTSESFFQNERRLTDQLSFAKSPAAYLRATAGCQDRDRNKTQSLAQFSLPGKIPLYSILPIELLKPGALNNDVHCSLSFLAFDSSGASHSFSLGDLKINSSSLASGIDATSDTPVYTPAHLRTAGFRFARSLYATVILTCTDFSIVAPPTERRDFLLRELPFPADFTEGGANQKCRLLAVENQQTVFVSSEFPFHFRSELQIETHPIPNAVLATPGRPVFAVKMTNNTDDLLRLRWPKTNSDKFLMLFHVEKPGFSLCPGTTYAKIPTVASLVFDKKENLKWLDTAQFSQFEIPAHATASGAILIAAPPPVFYGPSQVRLFHPMELQAYHGENWVPLEKLDWNINEFPVWLGPAHFPAECGL